MPVKIFFCYAHEDEALLDKLKMQLRPLQRQGLIDLWHDREISAGTQWEHEIIDHLNKAQIILLLVSPDFMNSDYCYGVEMKWAIERHQRREAHVIPVILYHVHWQESPLGKLQALPRDAKPITGASWHSLNEALFNVADGIRKVIDELIEQSSILPKYEDGVDELDHFTLQFRKALSYAQEVAESFNHNYIGTEHLLLGLLREDDGVALKVLDNLGVELEKIRAGTEFIISRGERIFSGTGMTPRAKVAIDFAVEESNNMHVRYIGTEHLLLGLIREGQGIASGVLKSLGVKLEKARRETLRLLE